MNRIERAIKTATQLGFEQSAYYFLYRLGLTSGYYRYTLQNENQSRRFKDDAFRTVKIFDLPSRETFLTYLGHDDLVQLRKEADEILGAKVRLFGGESVDLNLKPPEPLSPWTDYETGKAALEGDVKMIWEPARFGWAYTLARAFYILKDDKYRQGFWGFTGTFLKSNPPYMGPNWTSGQEAALRLIALAFAAQVFTVAEVTETKRLAAMGKVIAVHAGRIPPTLIYARAQNNNHLLSEAAGLITAGYLLPHHPQSAGWLRLGWEAFNRGLEQQIDDQGVYIQHSVNYTRLILQLALWVDSIDRFRQAHPRRSDEKNGELGLTEANRKRLGKATAWLLKIMDKNNGRCPNLGPNDGASIQPLSVCSFGDYRPVLQAGALVFENSQPFGKGAWNEMSLWYGARPQLPGAEKPEVTVGEGGPPHVLENPVSRSWAYLRIAKLTGRPGHADQLHVDLWHQGLNIAMDAGTFSYNNPPPWNNALAGSLVHNTVTVNDADQMTRVSKFLWLDWAQARLVENSVSIDGEAPRLTGEHDGYRSLGILHRRSVVAQSDGSWLVEDRLLPSNAPKNEDAIYSFRLHWMLVDSPWEWEPGVLTLFTKKGILTVQINCEKPVLRYQLVRGGELQAGEGEISPTWGWVSPTYESKEPALSLSAVVADKPPLLISTRFVFHNY